jgi:phosphohistidine phosphatase SixA
MKAVRGLVVGLSFLCGAAALAQSPVARSSQAAAPLADAALAAALRKGGYVLYFRHAATDMSQNDRNMTSYEDCRGQRNLTDAGREDARAIARSVKQIGVPISRVIASPFCRTMDTARLIFGRAEPEASARGGPSGPEDAARYAELRRELGTSPTPGTHSVIVGHGNPFYALAGPPYLAEGEMAVVRPGGSNFQVVARVRPGDWKALAQTAR